MSLHFRITVDMRARMFPLLLDGGGEVITITAITADTAMEAMQEGIVEDFRDGIGKRAVIDISHLRVADC